MFIFHLYDPPVLNLYGVFEEIVPVCPNAGQHFPARIWRWLKRGNDQGIWLTIQFEILPLIGPYIKYQIESLVVLLNDQRQERESRFTFYTNTVAFRLDTEEIPSIFTVSRAENSSECQSRCP